jgi:hypothetical protein
LGARLHYAKVVDREKFMLGGGRVHPGLHNEVVLLDEPGKAAIFLILRAWGDDHGSFTEQWRIESPGGTVLYQSAPRDLHMPTEQHVEKLEDEVADLDFEFAGDGYSVAFVLDDRVVARVDFPVVFNGDGEQTGS